MKNNQKLFKPQIYEEKHKDIQRKQQQRKELCQKTNVKKMLEIWSRAGVTDIPAPPVDLMKL